MDNNIYKNLSIANNLVLHKVLYCIIIVLYYYCIVLYIVVLL